jgi:hypothetical protein
MSWRASEAEARRAVQAFESVGVREFVVLFHDDRTTAKHVETVDGPTLRQHLRDYLDRHLNKRESFIVGTNDPSVIQVDDCDETTRERLAPFAFLTHMTSPGSYQAWLCVSEARTRAAIRERLLAHLAPSGANGVPFSATRWPGSRNYKLKHQQADGAFPLVRLMSVAPGRRVTGADLERSGLLAPPASRLKPGLKRALVRAAGAVRFTRLAAYGHRRQVTILRYEGVTEHPGYSGRLTEWGHLRAELFEAQLDYLQRHCHVVSLRDYVSTVRTGQRLPDHSVVLTFDEGYRNFLTAAAPRLAARGFPATLFVVPERTHSDGDTIPVRWTHGDDETHLSWAQIEEVKRQGFEVGVLLHPAFITYSSEAARRALSDAYELVVAHTKSDAPPLAFRSGAYEPGLAEHARALGFACGLRRSQMGRNEGRSDVFALSRVRLPLYERAADDVGAFAAEVSGLMLWWCRLACRRLLED